MTIAHRIPELESASEPRESPTTASDEQDKAPPPAARAARRVIALVTAPGYVAFSVSNSALGLSGFRVVAKLDGKPGGDKLLSLAFSRICGYGLRQEQPTGGCGKERRVRVRGIISVVAVAALMAALIAVAALPAFAAGRTRLPAVDLVASRQ